MRNLIILMFALLVSSCNKNTNYTIEDRIIGDNIPDEVNYNLLNSDTVTDRHGKVKDGTLTYSHNAWQSVGKTYILDYNPVEFDVKTKHDFKNEKGNNHGETGGDEETVSYELHPKRAGVFTVCEVEGYRGKEIRRIKHIIKVKDNAEKGKDK